MYLSSAYSERGIDAAALTENPKVSLEADKAIVLYRGSVRGDLNPGAVVTEPSQNTVRARRARSRNQPYKSVVLAALQDITLPRDKKGVPILGEGFPLSAGTLDTIMRTISGQETAKGKREIIPADLLYRDAGRMIWFRPARRHPIWFRTGGPFDKEISGKEVLFPSLLFCAEAGGSLKIFALPSPTRPEADTPVYYAPFYNIFGSGGMCVGNVPIPRTVNLSDRPAWERALYETEFTHSNYGGGKFVNHPKGHDALWREMQERQVADGFPVDYLIKLKRGGDRALTVAEVIAE